MTSRYSGVRPDASPEASPARPSGSGRPQDLPLVDDDWRRRKMLETVAVVLIVLWLLGFLTSYTMGGLIHALLVVAVIVILIRVTQGRRL